MIADVLVADTTVMLGLALAGAAYAVGTERLSRHRRAPRWRIAAFAGALAVTGAALIGPLEDASHRWFAAHMVQHLLLVLVAAPLFVVARTGRVLAAAGPRFGLPMPRIRSRPPRLVLLVAATAALVGVLTVWHLPAVHDAALRSTTLHAVQHASMLAAALALAWAIARSRAGAHELPGVLALFVVVLHGAALGAWLTFAADPLVVGYTGPAHAAARLTDQQVAGLLMWVPGGLVPFFVALALVARALASPTPETMTRRAAIRARSASVAAGIAVVAVLAGCDATRSSEVGGGEAERGREAIRAYGCAACHSIPGIEGRSGRVGPALEGVTTRPYLAGQLRNDEEALAAFIRDPDRLVPGSGMPDLGVTASEARAIVRYLVEAG